MENIGTNIGTGQKNKDPSSLEPLILLNRGDVIRTRDLYVPNVALYQTEPHPEANKTPLILTQNPFYIISMKKSTKK